MNNVGMSFETFYNENILEYFKTLQESPFKLISLLIDIGIVLFLLYYAVKAVKGEDVEAEVMIPTYTYTKENQDEIQTYIDEHQDLVG